MKGMTHVFLRELRAQAPVAAVALVAAVLPWMAPLLPGLGSTPAAEVRQASAALVAGLLAVALGASTGTGLLARELSEGRLSFYFALPLRPHEIWLGKLLAACALVYGAAGLALLGLGGAILGGLREAVLSLEVDSPAHQEVAVVALLVVLLVSPLLLVLLAHHLAVAVRSRSPWLIVDLAVIGLAAAFGAWSLTRLLWSLAYTELAWGAVAACAALVVAFGVAGWAGLARGGVVPARFHRTQALASALCLVAASGALGSWASWVLTPGVGSVSAVDQVAAAPAGGWALALAETAGRPSFTPWMLIGPGGHGLRLSPGLSGFGLRPPLEFSADGRAAVWRRPVRHALGVEHELVWLTLDAGAPRVEPTGIVVEGAPRIALTSGGLLAVRERLQLRVWQERGRVPRAAVRVADATPLAGELLSAVDGAAMLVSVPRRGPEAYVEVLTLAAPDWRARRTTPQSLGGGEPAATTFVEAIEVSPDRTRLVVVQGYGGPGAVTLHDVETGALLARLDGPANLLVRNVRFLADGTIAVPLSRAERLALGVFSPDGTPLRELPLGRGGGAELGGEWRPGRLLVSVVVKWRLFGARRELGEVDLATGRWRPLQPYLVPATRSPVPGDNAARLFHHQRDGTLVELDPETGALSQVLPLPAGRGGAG